MALRIERPTKATEELVNALGLLIPQLNPALAAPTAEHLAVLFADKASTLLIARDGNKIVGTAMVIVYPTTFRFESRIEDVVVDESARGRGVGEALVKECIEVARSRGAAIVELQTARSREAANRLYERIGFERRDSNPYRMTLR
ncbi:MAG TPA: GNAT family N-acetyltransferase [Candidatus Dormibacteraeota bacterium]|nr:GNAT family N-acetyltransferase [Candidatus Dormibacteraeota bacterium]